jgi:2-deoxy-D-gluconate 3-dehydrogenase
MNKHFSMEGKVSIITGAGKGIGREVAKLFYTSGAKIALISRNEKDLSSLKNECKFKKEKALLFHGDVSNESNVKQFVALALKTYRKIDILINNAGMRFRKPFLDISTDEWKNVIWVNLGSVYLMSREVGKQMLRQRGGKIINLASIVGTFGLPDLCAYGASKGGIITFTKCLALEWARFNINVNAIAPGFCETSFFESFKKKKELYDFTLERTPKGHWGKPQDIANACLYLSSDMADYVTGEVLTVDGGWSAW